ncbi:SDR family oxidoreductase [Synechococcus sp. CBW1006]|uniref:SDR family oxidoreductase n=1 Tax=Synechococcus sp. CBW1006 TaxID=1353138 RepID=UPI001E2F75E6|nr:SDR family oxidoreductase [Synechococcus sp. CBW1006]
MPPSSAPLPLLLPAALRPRRVLVVGGGYSGNRFAAALSAQAVPVITTHRRPADANAPLTWLPFDSEAGIVPGRTDLEGFSHVLTTVPPGRDGRDPVLDLLGPLLRSLPLQWLGVLSTTGVYGDTAGAWVDETAPLQPSLERSRARVASEAGWRALGLPLQIFRLPAIYGPGRSPFASLRSGRSRLIHKPGQVFSRIHVDDIVGALLHNLALPAEQRPPVLNVSDNRPCPSSETLGYAAHLIGHPLPPVASYDAIADTMSPMARSFWSENRRVGNLLLCQKLEYRLRYPSYREGYRACLQEENGTPEPD